MATDIRYAIRTLRRTPGFTTIAIATVALGIAANTAIFSIVNAVLLRPLPFRDESRIVRVVTTTSEEPKSGHSAGEFLDLQARNHSLAAVAGYREDLAAVSPRPGDAEQLEAAYVTANFFDVLGTPARLGRTFSQAQDGAARERLVVLSDAAWQRVSAAGPATIGMPLRINGQTYTVAGVMPREFHWPEGSRLWLLAHGPVPPSPFDRSDVQDPLEDREVRYFDAIARLQPGVTLAAAQADLDVVAASLPADADGSERHGFHIAPIREDLVGDVRQALVIIQAAVGLVLLIACANVSSLLIARATGRRRELAIRAAVGASRGNLLRQLLIESVLLGAAGGVLGLLGGSWLIQALMRVLPEGVPRTDAIGLDATVTTVTIVASLGTGIVFGILPALQASRTDAASAMKEGGPRGSARNRGRSVLVVAEVAITLVLLVGAGLLGTSFLRLQRVSSGFNPDHVVVASLSVPQARYPRAADQVRVYQQLVERLERRPGVQSAAVGFPGPLHGSSARGAFDVEGFTAPAGKRPSANLAAVSGGYFASMGLPLISGRSFTSADTESAPPVAVVNSALARKYWPGQDPIGKHLRFDEDAKEPWITVVGLVGDSRQLGLSEEPPPILYVPYQVLTLPFTTVSIRSSLSTADVTSIMRSELAAVDPDLAFTDVETLPAVFDRYLGEPRFRALALITFAVLALILAAVGLYGLISFSVAQRTREIGIRVALGARPDHILRSVIREGVTLAAAGVLAGTIVAIGVARLLRSFLYGVGAADPWTFTAVAALMLIVAVAASYIPSRRALRVDPLVALRAE